MTIKLVSVIMLYPGYFTKYDPTQPFHVDEKKNLQHPGFPGGDRTRTGSVLWP
jgi:hypothetical protein